MRRSLAGAACLVAAGFGLAGCAAVAPAEWAAVGAIAGAAGAALTLDDEVLNLFVGTPPTTAPAPATTAPPP